MAVVGGGRYKEVVIEGGGCYNDLAVVRRWSLQGVGCFKVMVAVRSWLLYGGCCYKLAVERWW